MYSFLKNIPPDTYIALASVVAIIAYAVGYINGVADVVAPWMLLVLVPGTLFLWYGIVKSMLGGNFGVDLIAGVAIGTALLLEQYLAGVVVLLMLSGGQALESHAFSRARRDLARLLSRMPEYAHVRDDNALKETPLAEVAMGAIIAVKPGEVIPLDGVIVEQGVFIDESSVTGESVPVEKKPGARALSGTTATTTTVYIQVDTKAEDSTYSRIIALIKEAEESRPPMVRMADQYSVYFTAATFAFALLAWVLSHDALRVLAVLVVATPCPLILATPIAFMSGISKASARGFVIKSGRSLEVIARARTFVFDKTGTLTLGEPQVHEVVAENNTDVLRIAASLDQLSTHVLAKAIVAHAEKEGKELVLPTDAKETFGHGVTGTINGTVYALGKFSFIESFTNTVPASAVAAHEAAQDAGYLSVFLATKNAYVGHLVLSDELRDDTQTLFESLRSDAAAQCVLLTGDKQKPAQRVAASLGITNVQAEMIPEEKVSFVRSIQAAQRPVVMVGDGINDAPALKASDVGIALGSHGMTAVGESADVVLLTPALSRLHDLLRISRRTVRVAREGIWIGIGLSVIAMAFAGLGFIPPVVGALIQEVIDIVVIVNALRVGRGV